MNIFDDNVFETRNDSFERFWIKVQVALTIRCIILLSHTSLVKEVGTNPDLTDDLYVNLLSEVLGIQGNDEHANIVILGDFNGKIGSHKTNGDSDINYNGQCLLNFCDDSDLTILNCSDLCSGTFTWFKNQHKSVLDYADHNLLIQGN